MDAARERERVEYPSSASRGDPQDSSSGGRTDGADAQGGVPAAIVTAAVREVCKDDALCERFSNVENSLAGASFEAVQGLLDQMDAPPGRDGVW